MTYAKETVASLKKLCSSRGLKLNKAKPLKADYVAALTAADASSGTAPAAQEEPAKKARRKASDASDTSKRGGGKRKASEDIVKEEIKKEELIAMEIEAPAPVPAPVPAPAPARAKPPAPRERVICPYIDTITRSTLDFDATRACSVSLSTSSVYGCLVCGKFFAGKGNSTPAYTHSVETGHSVYVTLTSNGGGPPPSPPKFYCLPDNYEIVDEPSLSDITHAINPTFTPESVAALSSNTAVQRDIFNNRYLPGYTGLNNLNSTDYISAVITSLAQVAKLRDFFLLQKERPRSAAGAIEATTTSTDVSTGANLVYKFGELVRKMWSGSRFRSGVDPKVLVNEIVVRAKGRFTIGRQENASEFCVWLVNELHQGLASIKGGKKSKKKRTKTIITEVFEGLVEVTTISKREKKEDTEEQEVFNDSVTGAGETGAADQEEDEFDTKTMDTPFLQLTLDIPEKPLYKNDASGALTIPQDTLSNIMTKFNGDKFVDVTTKGVLGKRRYRLKKLPEYLVLHLSRFRKTAFGIEKNPTIVTFPIKNLDLNDYMYLDNGSKASEAVVSEEAVRKMGIKEMKAMMAGFGKDTQHVVEKEELVKMCLGGAKGNLNSVYDLVSNVCHDNPAEVGKEGDRNVLEEGSYRAQVEHGPSKQWFEIRELDVKDVLPEQIILCESLILIFRRKTN